MVLSYVKDFDKYYLCALVSYALESDADALPDLFHEHISSTPSLKVDWMVSYFFSYFGR